MIALYYMSDGSLIITVIEYLYVTMVYTKLILLQQMCLNK